MKQKYWDMLHPQEKTAIALLTGVIALLTAAHLVLGALGTAPFAAAYSGEAAPGDLVILEGTVDDARTTAQGGHTILTINGTTVFIPRQVADGRTFAGGQVLSVTGTLELYEGTREVVPARPDDVVVLTFAPGPV
ncbi:hypothetical protein AZH53_09230 [Methanomicrobiaceae archaeon CYW5]|uniref:hypothetical protein n=1 Tax=Methanovulcanius yangii TaxID=1789227 RepID=UPI0029CA0782|nr:hypothetical protein [Methanovulcanius yangii]MBT8508586.1 hypothetical protein [Methanovulcanius yangii]